MNRISLVIVCLLGSASCDDKVRDERTQIPIRVKVVGGHQLEILVEGISRETPTVILESGLGGRIEGWSKVRESLRTVTRVVSYHRAGIGGSQPGPIPRSADQIVTELRSALRQLNIRPPYILVGHSIGGMYVRAFAGQHPDEVAALVLLDPTMEMKEELEATQVTDRLQKYWKDDYQRVQAVLDRVHPKLAEIAAQSLLGLELFLDQVPPIDRSATRKVWLKEFADRTHQVEGMLALIEKSARQEMFATLLSSDLVRAQPIDDIPVALLIAENPDSGNNADRAASSPTRSAEFLDWARDARTQRYTEFIETIAEGRMEVLKDTSHDIPQDRPDAIVAAVRRFLIN